MGKIKGWKLKKDNKTCFMYESENKKGVLVGDPPFSRLNEGSSSWKVSAWSLGIFTHNKFTTTKEQAKEIAIRYMKAHPRG